MNCSNCTLFKEKFGRNIRPSKQIEDCAGDMPNECLIMQILDMAEHNQDTLADTICYGKGYDENLKEASLLCAIDLFDLDSELNRLAAWHDEWIDNVAEAIENGPDDNIPF